MFEGLSHNPRQDRIEVLLEALASQHAAVAACRDIGDDCKAAAFRGHFSFQVLP